MARPTKISEQSRKFMEAARALGCDEDEEAFKRVVRRVAGAKPQADSGSDSSELLKAQRQVKDK